MTTETRDRGSEGGEPIDTLEAYCAAYGWACERIGEDEILVSVEGSWTSYELRGVWREQDNVLQFMALPDIRVPPDRRAQVYETIGLVNEQLWIGHFELWSSSGILLFRHAALLDPHAEPTLTLDQAGLLFDSALDECERFYPVFQFVLWGGKSPADAITAAMIETHGEA